MASHRHRGLGHRSAETFGHRSADRQAGRSSGGSGVVAAGDDAGLAVRMALADLPAEQRQAVLLAYFGGYTQIEIAGLTGVPLSTVKGRMRLALDKLAAYLKERGVVDV